eukprot:TRINITY_DN1907_c1_g1_i1.p1 TRINITY_DN1907_c1_g1~~TRINITY_DN1907_c1_g1_i1.p1  ORF type:complete len:323 (+),score=40.69 TRINITY_DN1907_c1_g1_i1:58-1026(+)
MPTKPSRRTASVPLGPRNDGKDRLVKRMAAGRKCWQPTTTTVDDVRVPNKGGVQYKGKEETQEATHKKIKKFVPEPHNNGADNVGHNYKSTPTVQRFAEVNGHRVEVEDCQTRGIAVQKAALRGFHSKLVKQGFPDTPNRVPTKRLTEQSYTESTLWPVGSGKLMPPFQKTLGRRTTRSMPPLRSVNDTYEVTGPPYPRTGKGKAHPQTREIGTAGKFDGYDTSNRAQSPVGIRTGFVPKMEPEPSQRRMLKQVDSYQPSGVSPSPRVGRAQTPTGSKKYSTTILQHTPTTRFTGIGESSAHPRISQQPSPTPRGVSIISWT